MNASYWPILMIVAGGVLYQVSQKSLPAQVNAYFVIALAYAIGIAFCFLSNVMYPLEGTLTETIKRISWPVIGVAFGAALIEVGFVVAYRQGWKISFTSMLVNMVISLVLIPIGMLFFKEKISGLQVLGILFYFAGLVLLARK